MERAYLETNRKMRRELKSKPFSSDIYESIIRVYVEYKPTYIIDKNAKALVEMGAVRCSHLRGLPVCKVRAYDNEIDLVN